MVDQGVIDALRCSRLRDQRVAVKRLAEEIFTEEVQFGAGLDFHVAVDERLAGEAHRVFVADVGQARHGIESARGNRRRHRHFEPRPFDPTHWARVLDAFDDLHAARAALSEAVTVHEGVDRSAKSVEPRMHVDARLDSFRAEVRSLGNFDFLVLFDELDQRHIDGPLLRMVDGIGRMGSLLLYRAERLRKSRADTRQTTRNSMPPASHNDFDRE